MSNRDQEGARDGLSVSSLLNARLSKRGLFSNDYPESISAQLCSKMLMSELPRGPLSPTPASCSGQG